VEHFYVFATGKEKQQVCGASVCDCLAVGLCVVPRPTFQAAFTSLAPVAVTLSCTSTTQARAAAPLVFEGHLFAGCCCSGAEHTLTTA
jgi:hypothetical protein